MHLNLIAYGFGLNMQPQAVDMQMFLDQAHYIQSAINTVMSDPALSEGAKEFTIVGHSVGCLIAMLIEQEVNHPDFVKRNPRRSGGELKNVVCLGTPLFESPTKGLNRNLEDIRKTIMNKQAEHPPRPSSDVAYLFFNGGNKDYHITDKFRYDFHRGYTNRPLFSSSTPSIFSRLNDYIKNIGLI